LEKKIEECAGGKARKRRRESRSERNSSNRSNIFAREERGEGSYQVGERRRKDPFGEGASRGSKTSGPLKKSEGNGRKNRYKSGKGGPSSLWAKK